MTDTEESLGIIFGADDIRQSSLEHLARYSVLLRMKKGQHLYREREEIVTVYAVVSGTAALYKMNAMGEKKVIFVLGRGSLLNEEILQDLPEPVSCEIMEEAAARYHVKLQVAFMRRFDSAFMEARSVVDAGDIGDVVMVRSNTRGPSIPKPWMYDISKSNGPLAEVNSQILTPCAGLREVSSRRSMPWAAITAARTRERNSRISMTMSSCPQGLKTVCRV